MTAPTESDMPQRVRKAIRHNVVFRLLSQISIAATYVVLVRMLSETEFGIYQLFYTVPPVIAAVFSLGLTVTLSRYLPEYLNAGQLSYASTLSRYAMGIRFVSSIAILSVILYFWDFLAPLLKIQDYRDYFLIFFAITVTHFQCRLLTITLSSYLLQQWSMGLAAAFSIAKLAGYLVVGLFEFSLELALIVDLVAYVLWFLALTVARRSYIPKPEVREEFPVAERRRVVRFSLLNNFNDVGTLTLNSRTDNLFIAAFMTPAFVGAYAFCTQLEQMVQKLLPTRFFGSVVSAVVYRLKYVDDADRARSYFRFLLKLNYLGAFPIFVLVAAVPDELIRTVFGGKFEEFSHVLVATFAFSLASTFQQPVSVVAELGERAGIILASKIFAVYNVGANLVLIPMLGIMGAVIATGTAIFFKNAFIWFFVRDVATFRGTGRFFLQQAAIWLVCLAIVRTFAEHSDDIPAMIFALACVAITAYVSLRLADWSESDKQLLLRLGGTRLHRYLGMIGIRL